MISYSICIITKNECTILEECLRRLKPLGHEIVVLDTGSTDGTCDMVLKYTNCLHHFEWCNDFSAARNECIKYASNEYILTVDSDEYLTEWDEDKNQRMIETNPKGIGRIFRTDTYTQQGETRTVREGMGRFFSKKLYHYEGSIHEQIVPNNSSITASYYALTAEFDHMAYAGDIETRAKRSKRNADLLLKELEKNPDDTYFMFQLGQAYFMMEDYEKAVQAYGKALTYDLNPRLEYVQSMVESYGYALLYTKRYQEALGLEGVYEEFAINADFCFLMGLIYMNNALFDLAIQEFLNATKQKVCKVTGAGSYRAYYNIGVIYECTGRTEGALKYYKMCGDFEPAKTRIDALN
ncbi:MAG: glycosyltransferase [Lachnospiraceae bacterium]|nr:glycosyltransferase [Lachnospiraceae bacterium]